MLLHLASGQLRQGATDRTMVTYLSLSDSDSSSSSHAGGAGGGSCRGEDEGVDLGVMDVCLGA